MDKTKRPNIYWFIIDSVRTYKTGADDRDRVDILDEVGQDATEFTNCVTGAPSSILSAGTIFTGLPSTFVARHFNDWKFEDTEISTIATLKESFNYETYPILDTRDLRVMLHNILPALKHKELPKEYRLSDYVWHNRDVTKIFKHYLSKEDPDKNHAYVMWYDCRRDAKTSDHVKEAIDAIKAKGDFDNSVIIMHSDHGYPDPTTQLNEEYFKGIGHDMVLTDDNIKVPLILKTPGGPKGLKFEHQVGLIDVLPTIFDSLKIDYKKLNTSFQGHSLLPILRGEEQDDRMRKTDTRLPMDVKRIGSIRNNDFKYIYLYKDEMEFLYDLKKDPKELNNVVGIKEYAEAAGSLRAINKKYEEELFFFHEAQVKKNLEASAREIMKKVKSDSPRILIITMGIELIIDLVVKQFQKDFHNPEIELVVTKGKEMEVAGIHKSHYVNAFNKAELTNLELSKLDLTLFMTENSSRVFLKKDEVDAVKSLDSGAKFLMNFNFELFNYFSSKWFKIAYIKLFFDWDTKGYFYKQEPLYFFRDVSVFVKYLFIKTFNALSKKKADIDLHAAREAMDYRDFIMKDNQSGEYDQMEKDQLQYEVSRLNTRDD